MNELETLKEENARARKALSKAAYTIAKAKLRIKENKKKWKNTKS